MAGVVAQPSSVYWIALVYVVYALQDADALLFAGAALPIHFFLSWTSTGRFIYARGENAEAARLSGIVLRPLRLPEHVLAAVFAWLAGLVWIGQTGNRQSNTAIIGTQIVSANGTLPTCRAG